MLVMALAAMATPAINAQRHNGTHGNDRTERRKESARPAHGSSGRPGVGSSGRPGGGGNNHRPGAAGNSSRPSVGNGNHRPSSANGNHRPEGNKPTTTRPGSNTRPSTGTSGRPGVGSNHRPETGGNSTHRPGVGSGNGTHRPGGNKPEATRPGTNNRPGVGTNHRPGVGTSGRPGVGGNHNRPAVNHRPGVGGRPVNRPVSRPPMIAPPHRPYRPVIARPHYRPVPPPAWRPRRGLPVIRGILGLTFGAAFNVSLDYLYNSGYTVDGYGNNIVYLRNVPAMNYIWTDGALYYGNSGLDASSFYYSTPGYDMSRYNAVYANLVNAYGVPVSVNNAGGMLTSTWFGGNNGYITLSFGAGTAGRFLTTLTLGL